MKNPFKSMKERKAIDKAIEEQTRTQPSRKEIEKLVIESINDHIMRAENLKAKILMGELGVEYSLFHETQWCVRARIDGNHIKTFFFDKETGENEYPNSMDVNI